MPLLLIALFIIFPIVEIALLVQFGERFGFWTTMAVIIGTAIFGTTVLQHHGFQVMNRAMESLNAGRPPIGPVVDGAFVMLAGILLITPGLISDSLGLLLLVPWIRHRVAAFGVRRALKAGRVHVDVFTSRTRANAQARAGEGSARAGTPPHGADAGDGPIIEGDFERIDEQTVDGRTGRPDGGPGPRPPGSPFNGRP